MFERFRDSLVYPSRIIGFRNDSLLRVLTYIFMFSVLMSIGMIIFSIRFASLPNTFVNIFEEDLISKTVDCEIDDSMLVCDSEIREKIYDDASINIYVDSFDEINYEDMGVGIGSFNFIFHKEEIVFYSAGFNISFALADLPEEFQDIDFKVLETDTLGFAVLLLDAVSAYMVETKGIWAPFMIAVEIITNLFFMFAIVLINAWILKSRFKVIPFKEVFKMATYSSTTLYVLLTINGLISLGFLMIVLFVILTFRQTNALSMAIHKVIKKK